MLFCQTANHQISINVIRKTQWPLVMNAAQRPKIQTQTFYCRSQWPCGLRRTSAAARLLRSWVRMFVHCECCVLSSRGLCVGLITYPEKNYQSGVSEWDHESSTTRRSWPNRGCSALVKKILLCCLNCITFYGGANPYMKYLDLK
jgi:hypothetical protein